MKVLSEVQAKEILEKLGKNSRDLGKIRRAATKARKRKKRGSRGPQAPRPLCAGELQGNPHLRRTLENQGVRPAKGTLRFAPSVRLSVELRGCGHRARVLVLGSGFLPARARCPQCLRWRDTLPGTARAPVQSATRTVVSERLEERDGQMFQVKILAPPRRLRKGRAEEKPATGLPRARPDA